MRKKIEFAAPDEKWRLLIDTLNNADLTLEEGCICLVKTSTGRSRTTYLLYDIIVPYEGDVKFSYEKGLQFSFDYRERARLAAIDSRCGMLFLHTHPMVSRPGVVPVESDEDLEADGRDLYFLQQELPDGTPLLAGVLGSNGMCSIRLYQFVTPAQGRPQPWRTSARHQYLDTIRIVGKSLTRLPATPERESDYAISSLSVDSTVKLWGQAGQSKLAGLTVALIGAGGVGGILAEHISRLGIGKLLIIDYDILTRANFNRSQAAKRRDYQRKRLKSKVAERTAWDSATAADFEAESYELSIVEEEGLRVALDADIILNAADSDWARQVLDYLSYAHLIPVIDGGTEFRLSKQGNVIAAKSQVTSAGVGHVCFACVGNYTAERATEAREHPSLRGERGYFYQPELDNVPVVRSPSVISSNAVVAGLMGLRLSAICVGIAPQTRDGQQRYHILDGDMDWNAIDQCRAGCDKSRYICSGDQMPGLTGIDQDKRHAESNRK